jgi:hypothetical protein
MLDASTERFIVEAAQLPAASLAQAYEHTLRLRKGVGREASRATKPSASENSELERKVRSALLAASEQLDEPDASLRTRASSAVTLAARAVLKRSTISAEHYGALTEPFSMVGVAVPAHDAPDAPDAPAPDA